ncbi:MAG: CooT family nickel-binding protein [Desulfococcaceae bacterium]|nr:CooT family nickel-binding protein [Desulfococcaceae bacterium]
MCEADAYMVKKDGVQLIMESVDIVEPEEKDRWKLVGIFGDQKIVRGKIIGMNLVNHKIFFEPQEH